MNFPENLKYAKTHEWVRILEGGVAEVGITDFAQKELGDIVFVSLPKVGDKLIEGASFADVESVKAVSEIFSPLTGAVEAVNQTALDSPESLNTAPYDTWLIKVKGTPSDALLSAADYQKLL